MCQRRRRGNPQPNEFESIRWQYLASHKDIVRFLLALRKMIEILDSRENGSVGIVSDCGAHASGATVYASVGTPYY